MEKGISETHRIFLTSPAGQGTQLPRSPGQSKLRTSRLHSNPLCSPWQLEGPKSHGPRELHHIPSLCSLSCSATSAARLAEGHGKRELRPTPLQGCLLGAPWQLARTACCGQRELSTTDTSLTSHFVPHSCRVPTAVDRGRCGHSTTSSSRTMPRAPDNGSLAQARSTTC